MFYARHQFVSHSVDTIYSFAYSDLKVSESNVEEMVGQEVDIATLTIEEYMAHTRGDIGSCVVRPTVADNTQFEIKLQFMSGGKIPSKAVKMRMLMSILISNWRLLICSTFLRVTHGRVMLRACPSKLKGQAKRWKNKQPIGTTTTWALLKKAFLKICCPPFKTAKHVEEIHNFK
ncbi:hypothetical protein Tco_0601338 [Tanacetum coccineum]